MVCDGGFLRSERESRKALADALECRVDFVDSETVVPVAVASDKREYAARTLRPKLARCREDFLTMRSEPGPAKSSLPLHVKSELDLSNPEALITGLSKDSDVGAVERFQGGASEARRRLTRFLRRHLPGYASARMDPADPCTSELSPYLATGQISPLEIATKVLRASAASDDDKEAFLEELIVRRELAFNYVCFESEYDSYQSLPDWAKATLDEHRNDDREKLYTRKQLEAIETGDAYWNAAMTEMVETGYMHNYMRMYWGKKILEWSESPESAYDTVLHLNNKYFLDAHCENSFANVGWIFGLHDRAWSERPVFGKVRYMNANGLESKFDIDRYVQWAATLRG